MTRNTAVQFLLTTFLLLSGAATAFSQVAVSGKVHDVEGQPLSKVVVSIPEWNARTYSDEQGNFSIPVAQGATGQVTVVFDSPTCYSQTITVKLELAGATMDVALTPRSIVKQEVNVIASRLDVPLEVNPAATSVVVPQTLAQMPRGVAPEEALESVPSVKVDNQANGERVHISIRGQGILSEHGIRGIEVLLNGIPLSDPSGFVPDLFDVDWNGIQEVQVMRGPVAVLYGGGSAGGVIDLRTHQPEETSNGSFWSTGGSNGFYKARGEYSGTVKGMGYDFALSRNAGDGYRDHTRVLGRHCVGAAVFQADAFASSECVQPGHGVLQPERRRTEPGMARGEPPAGESRCLTYNEYQKTSRFTGGVSGDWKASENQDIAFTLFTRPTWYTESVPSSVQHRDIHPLEGSVQYNFEQHGARSATTSEWDSIWAGSGRRASAYPNMGDAVRGSESGCRCRTSPRATWRPTSWTA